MGLDLGEARLLVRLVSVENGEIGSVSILVLEPREIEARLGRIGRFRIGLQRLGVMLESSKGIGDVLECGEHSAAILFR